MEYHHPAVPLLIRGRLLQIMDALERTGGTPIDTRTLHAFAFFANVLSPLWDLEPLDGSILKDKRGPYYPALQRELDALVGDGLVTVVSLRPAPAADGSTELEARFRLATDRARSVLGFIGTFPDEVDTGGFLVELASAFLEIVPNQRDDAALVDAAYSDPSVSGGRIVDFAEWVKPTIDNPSWNTAQSFQRYMPEGITLNRAEKLLMYMRLLKRRAHG
jgi:hypothetical protein